MIETLFFKCYYSYLRGDLLNTQLYYDLLQSEFKTTGKKDSLQDHQFNELRSIRDSLKTGSITTSSWIAPADQSILGISEPESTKQKDLVVKIHENVEQLQIILGESVYLYNIEQPCQPYGTVDMVYMGKDTVYPLEVKKGQGRHDLIGQIAKYTLHHRLLLHYHLYKFVQPVTICSSYLPYAHTELNRLNVCTIVYSPSGSKINLKKI